MKWKGYDQATPERLTDILRDVTDPEILKQIEDRQRDYYDMHPTEQTILDQEDYAPLKPTRVQPARPGRERTYFMLHDDSPTPELLSASIGLGVLTHGAAQRSVALNLMLPDFRECPTMLAISALRGG